MSQFRQSVCPWCRVVVILHGGRDTCPACGHRAGIPRALCDCDACEPRTVDMPRRLFNPADRGASPFRDPNLE
jgi:hypothetical protein